MLLGSWGRTCCGNIQRLHLRGGPHSKSPLRGGVRRRVVPSLERPQLLPEPTVCGRGHALGACLQHHERLVGGLGWTAR
jgi:hypothetical protein